MNDSLPPLPPGDWDASLGEVIEDMQGNPLQVHRLMAHHPELLRAWWSFRNHTARGGALTDRERELVILTTARHLRNSYEWRSHLDRGIAAGVTREEIEWIRNGGGRWNARDSALVGASRALLEQQAIPPDGLARLRAHYSSPQILDVIFLCGAYVTLGLLLNTFEVPLDEAVARRVARLGLDSLDLPG